MSKLINLIKNLKNPLKMYLNYTNIRSYVLSTMYSAHL